MTWTPQQQSRILIIDDDQDIWNAYRMVLAPTRATDGSSAAIISHLLDDGKEETEEEIFRLAFAGQGQEGCELAAAARDHDPFAMAFIDVRMPPGWDGMETAVRIRQIDPDMELVIVTAYSDRSMAEIVRAVGASDKLLFLRKPFDSDELNQMARCLTAKWRLAREEKRQRQALQLAENQLRQAQKMEAIGTLAGGIAHDFNNILSAIIGYTELAQMRAENNSVLQENLAQVRKAADRATELARQILTVSRREQREYRPLQIALVIKEALKLLRASIPSTIEIRQDIASKALVMADPTQIHQLIMNLCTNAFHAMQDRGGILTVSVQERVLLLNSGFDGSSSIPAASYLALSVSDTGCGMDQEILARIFDPYFTTKEQGKGTGLGLAVCQGIVKSHHGDIQVTSEPGKGSTFTVYLPVTETPATAATTTAASTMTNPGKGERIMVVDDELPIRMMLSELLTHAGYCVDLFANGFEAWHALSQSPQKWDLLLTDQTMPEMTGDQLTLLALSVRPKLPVILCSGNLDTSSTRLAQKDVVVFLQKPVDLDTLLTTVAKALGSTTD